MITAFKIIGGLFIVIAGGGLGSYKAYEVKIKRDFMKKIRLGLDSLCSEIRLGKGDLFAIVERVFSDGNVKVSSKGFVISEKYINRRDLERLNEMLFILGSSDIKGECEKIEVYKEIFDDLYSEYDKRYKENRKVWQTLGIGGGVAVVLLMI